MNNYTLSLSDIIIKYSIFFSRKDVLIQVFIIIFSLVVGWLLSKIIWAWLRGKFSQFTTFILNDTNPMNILLFLSKLLIFP